MKPQERRFFGLPVVNALAAKRMQIPGTRPATDYVVVGNS